MTLHELLLMTVKLKNKLVDCPFNVDFSDMISGFEDVDYHEHYMQYVGQ